MHAPSVRSLQYLECVEDACSDAGTERSCGAESPAAEVPGVVFSTWCSMMVGTTQDFAVVVTFTDDEVMLRVVRSCSWSAVAEKQAS